MNVFAPPAVTRLASAPSHGATFLFTLFLAATLVVPGAFVNKVPFVLMFVWTLWDLGWKRRPNPFPSAAPLAIAGIFGYGFAMALMHRVDMAVAVQLTTSVALLFLVYFVAAHNIDFDRLSVRFAFLLLFCTALFWIAIVTPGMPFAAQIYHFFIDYNFSAATDREFFEGGATFTLQLGTTPFLFVSYCVVGMRLFSAERRRWDGVCLAMIGAGILMSGLRGLVGITVFYSMYLVIRAIQPRHRWMVVLTLATAFWMTWLYVFSGSQAFSSQEESNSVKIGHFTSYLKHLTWLNGLFGEGLASFYFSTGSAAMKAFTELTPVDMCRYLGIPLTIVLYLALFFPLPGIWRYKRHQWGYTVAMLLFTAMSMTNPVMFNSYGLLVVVWYWCSLLPMQRGPQPVASSHP